MNLKYWISQAMKLQGGSFVQALGGCILAADDDNYAKLEAAFPLYFEIYTEVAERLKSEDDAKP